LTGGSWPDESEETPNPFAIPKKLSKHLVFTGKNVERLPNKPYDPARGVPIPPGYVGIIAKATNEASKWTTLVNLTNEGLYFNQISCTDQNNCWAVCEGNNVTNGLTAAWIFATTNGWQSYTTQLYYELGSLTTIQMLNPTFGWAAGAYIGDGETSMKGSFYQTTDGQTWVAAGTLDDFYATDLSVTDPNTAFASGITEFGLSSFARYSSN